MTLSESFVLVSFTLFSFADLRYRLVPGIELFFLGTILIDSTCHSPTNRLDPVRLCMGTVPISTQLACVAAFVLSTCLAGPAHRIWISKGINRPGRLACH